MGTIKFKETSNDDEYMLYPLKLKQSCLYYNFHFF